MEGDPKEGGTTLRTVIVATRKGGVGKTTIAVHLAWYLAEQLKRVLVIDLDGQANASQTLAMYAVPGAFASRLFEAATLPTMKPTPVLPEDGAIALIPADKKLDDLGMTDAQRIIPLFVKHLSQFAKQFDVCIIDTPPSAGVCGFAAMIGGDSVLSPIKLDSYSKEGIQATVQTVMGVTKRFNKRLRFIGILPNELDGRSASQQTAFEQLLRDFGHMVIPTAIRKAESIATVPLIKLPVWKLGTTSSREHGKSMKATFKLIQDRVFA